MKKQGSVNIINQRGSMLIVVLIVIVAIGGIVVSTGNFDSAKRTELDIFKAKEDYLSLKEEFLDLLESPTNCMDSLGNNFQFDYSQALVDETSPGTAQSLPQLPNLTLTNGPESITSTPFRIAQDDDMGSRFKNIKIKNINFSIPSTFDTSLALQSIEGTISLHPVTLKGNEEGKDFDKIEKALILKVKKLGASNLFRVLSCRPKSPAEMRPVELVNYRIEGNRDVKEIISKNGKDKFKLCVISAFRFKPDNGPEGRPIPGKYHGDIAIRAPADCHITPLDSSNNPTSPELIEEPVRWEISLNADSMKYTFGFIGNTYHSDGMCEAVCF